MRTGAFLVSTVVLLGGVVVACSGDDKPGAVTLPQSEGGQEAGSNEAGVDTGADAVFHLDAGSDGACETTCSSDLHSVLDCHGFELKKCPEDQGCSKGGCVAACESAAANGSSIGCDYYSLPPEGAYSVRGACFAAFVANTWSAPVSLELERGNTKYDAAQFARIPTGSGTNITYAPLPNGKIPKGEVAIVFLARFENQSSDCPIPAAFTTADSAFYGTGVNAAFHLKTSAPVTAYDIYPYGGGASAVTGATLLLPTSVWDKNYVAVDAYQRSPALPSGRPWIAIVAAENNTKVTINPVVDIPPGPDGGLAGTTKGVPKTYTLNRGQALQFSQDEELMGSPVEADKPVGFWGGSVCLVIPVDATACDSAHQQIPPVKALGHEYVGVRYRNRRDGVEESPPWRLLGVVDGTTLTYDPVAPTGAPSSLQASQVVEFRSAGPFRVKSQDKDHPFYLSAYMTGASEVGNLANDFRGDPEFVTVIPPQQFLRSYVFFADPTYSETNLVLVRTKTQGSFKDVSLDCAGTIKDWQPVGNAGEYEYARIDLVRFNFEGQNGCNNGRHEIASEGPFGLTVWGWGTGDTGGALPPASKPGFFTQNVSYAYPAGASVVPLSTVVVPSTPK